MNEICDTTEWVDLFTEDATKKRKKGNLYSIIHYIASKWTKIDVFIFGLGIPTALFLGIWGYQDYFIAANSDYSFLDLVYYALQLFLVESNVIKPIPITLEVARFLAPLSLGYLSIRTFLSFFSGIIQAISIRLKRNHIVIYGANEASYHLMRSLMRKGNDVILIPNEDNTYVDEAKALGVLVLSSAIKSMQNLLKARIKDASHLVILTNDDKENLEFLSILLQDLPRYISPNLKLHVQLDNPALQTSFRSKVYQKRSNVDLEINFFNLNDNIARLLFQKYPIDCYAAVDDNTQPPHLVIVDYNDLGERILEQAARISHYGSEQRLVVTILDEDALKKEALFKQKYPYMEFVCDVFFEKVDTLEMGVLQDEYWNNPDKPTPNMVIICSPDEVKGITYGLTLHEKKQLPTFVKVNNATFKNLIEVTEFQHLHLFGSLDKISSAELIINETMTKLAKVIHKEYLNKKLAEGKKIGDTRSIKLWKDLSQSLKESNLHQADHIPIKLRLVGSTVINLEEKATAAPAFEFTPEEIEMLAKVEHNRWKANRFIDGYQYADIETTNHKTKESPFLVPFEELDEHMKDYDRYFVAKIPDILFLVDLAIKRID